MGIINGFTGEYRWLSNFTPVDIEFRGNIFPSVEHAYVSAKSKDPKFIKTCMDSNNSPGKIKRLCRSIEIVSNWSEVKDLVMSELVNKKFNTEPFKTLLINTGDSIIVETNKWHDNYWGSCRCVRCGDRGKNTLGKLIMRIRDDINGVKRGIFFN